MPARYGVTSEYNIRSRHGYYCINMVATKDQKANQDVPALGGTSWLAFASTFSNWSHQQLDQP